MMILKFIEYIQNRIQYLVLISTILALFTTNTALIFNIFIGIGTGWISLDSFINCLCVILMFQVHSKQYIKICGCLDRNINNKCLLCCSCNYNYKPYILFM